MIAAGRDLKKQQKIEDADIEDVAPSILYEMGLELPWILMENPF